MKSSPALIIALGLAAALVVVLGQQNRELREAQQKLRGELAEPHAGMWVPSVSAQLLDGSTTILGRPDAMDLQVLYFFEPSCPYCLESLPAIKDLSKSIVRDYGPKAQMIGVSKAGAEVTREYMTKNGITFPVAVVSDERSITLFRAQAVPLIYVIDARGQVQHSHLGTVRLKEDVRTILAAMQETEELRTAATNGRMK